MNAKDCRRSTCPISFTLDLLGDRWTLLVIRDMVFAGKKHYGEFLQSDEKIATNILADRLKRLEEANVVSRAVDAEKQTKYVYKLTQKGIDLVPLVLELSMWGAKYDPKTGAPKKLISRMRKEREAVIGALVESLKAHLRN